MATQVRVEAIYASGADALFKNALRYDELTDAMSGLAEYEGLPIGEAQEGQTFDVTVTLWGWMKNPPHTIHVEKRDDAARLLQSREHGGWLNRWDHCLQIDADDRGAKWTDRIIIDAGWLTFVAAALASYIYKRRHVMRNALTITTKTERI